MHRLVVIVGGEIAEAGVMTELGLVVIEAGVVIEGGVVTEVGVVVQHRHMVQVEIH